VEEGGSVSEPQNPFKKALPLQSKSPGSGSPGRGSGFGGGLKGRAVRGGRGDMAQVFHHRVGRILIT